MPARVVDIPHARDPLAALIELGHKLLAMPRPKLAAYMSGSPPARRAVCEYALGAVNAHWRQDPSTMLAKLDDRYRPHRLARFLGSAFRRAADGLEPRQAILAPSRVGKSRVTSQGGTAWALDRDPAATFILCSYAYELAAENAHGVRDMLTENPEHLRVRLRPDRKRHDRWVTTAGGGILAAGIGGSIIGFGAGAGLIGAGGGVVIDDPFKNWMEAHSKTHRDRVWNFYRSVLRLRLDHDDAFIQLLMARWHLDDLMGRITTADETGDGETWTLYRLPALADQVDDLLGRALGEPLVPEVFDLEAVQSRARVLGSYLASAMEQQDPAPEEGGELKRAWWQWGDIPPATPDDSLTSWDMKMKDNTRGDYVVGQAWHRYASTAWCVDQLRGQWDLTMTRAAVALMQVRHPHIRRHVIENAGNGPEVMEALRRGIARADISEDVAGALGMNRDERIRVEELLRRGISGIVPNTVTTDKVTRARTAAPHLEAGDIFLPLSAANGWALGLVNECAAFPDPGTPDDQVDAWSQGVTRILGAGPGHVEMPPATARVSLPQPGHIGRRMRGLGPRTG